MPRDRPWGVLLAAGANTHQESYGPGFAADPRCRVAGVTDEPGVDSRRAALNRRLAEEMKVPLLPDFDDALRRPDVDLVSICAEHERQARIAVRCARAGKHLYMDKPLAGSLAGADSIVDAVRMNGLRGQMFSQINLPYAQRAKRMVESGQLGKIRAIHCDLMFAKGWPGTAALGQPRKESYPPAQFLVPDAKRELFNIAVYSVALIRWLMRREVLSVRAVTANYFFQEHQRRGMEDFGLMALTLEDGVTATITAGRIGWMSHFGSGPNLTRLYGDKGSVLIDAFRPRAEVASGMLDWKRPPRDPEDPMGFWRGTQVRAGITPRPEWLTLETPVRSDQSLFIDCLESGQEPEVSVFDGAKAVEVLFAAYRSAATGEVVSLPLPR
ncbi:MAG: Gfo/Idh/MocA family oxidoreductase [Candidatus Solibacter usitatus]|nr:Gfo/Idh/MocA family oxidoreductase [Candidatus Solibacter usitatus]